MFRIKTLNGIDWDAVEELNIDKFNWEYDFKPLSFSKVCLLKNQGICIRMWSYEDNPVSKHKLNNENVYEDSCLEFFFNAYPESSDIYLNFEVNHKGVMLAAFGSDRHSRKFLSELNITYPEVDTFNGKDTRGEFWGIEYEIPFHLIETVYGISGFSSDHRIKAAFYKCGDKTGRPHYGSWQLIETPSPDFHRPEFFGTLIIDL